MTFRIAQGVGDVCQLLPQLLPLNVELADYFFLLSKKLGHPLLILYQQIIDASDGVAFSSRQAGGAFSPRQR